MNSNNILSDLELLIHHGPYPVTYIRDNLNIIPGPQAEGILSAMTMYNNRVSEMIHLADATSLESPHDQRRAKHMYVSALKVQDALVKIHPQLQINEENDSRDYVHIIRELQK